MLLASSYALKHLKGSGCLQFIPELHKKTEIKIQGVFCGISRNRGGSLRSFIVSWNRFKIFWSNGILKEDCV